MALNNELKCHYGTRGTYIRYDYLEHLSFFSSAFSFSVRLSLYIKVQRQLI